MTMLTIITGEHTMADGRPDPSVAADLADFTARLLNLVAWAGAPSHRELAKRVGPLMHPPQTLSKSTISDLFLANRRRLNLDLVVAIVRALGLDHAEVGRWRQACIRVHADAKAGGPVGAFQQLPADLATFTGRERATAEITDELCARSAAQTTVVVCALEGMAGVGKTVLAVRIAHEFVRRGYCPDVQLFVNLRGFDAERPPADPSAILDAFLRQLQVPAQLIPDSVDERAAMFRARLHDKRALILLDNAADEDQVRDLLPSGVGCVVLVTSRRTFAALDGAISYPVGPLGTDEAITLLARVAGREIESEPDSARLVDACGRLPLAVALAGARLRSRPTWTAADLCRHLGDGGLDAFSVGNRSITPVFDLSYQALNTAARRLLLLLASHPGPDICAEAATVLCGGRPGPTRALLEVLCDEYLVLQPTQGRFELHDLLRAYALDKACTELEPDELREALRRLFTWYTVTADAAGQVLIPGRFRLALPQDWDRSTAELRFADAHAVLGWFQREWPTLAAAADAAVEAGEPYLAWRLPAALSTFLGVTGAWADWHRLHHRALPSARREPDLAGAAWVLSNLGISARKTGRLDETLAYFTEALALRRTLGDAAAEATTLTNLAAAHDTVGRADLGLECSQEALEIHRRLGNRAGEATALNNLAAGNRTLRRPEAALDCFRAALLIREEIGDRFNASSVWRNIGETCIDVGRLDEAETALQRAKDGFRALHARAEEAEALEAEAELYQLQGRDRESLACVHQALAIWDELALPQAAALRSRLGADQV